MFPSQMRGESKSVKSGIENINYEKPRLSIEIQLNI